MTAQQEFLHSGFGKSPTLVIWGEIEIHTQPWTPWSYTHKELSNLSVRIVDLISGLKLTTRGCTCLKVLGSNPSFGGKTWP